MNFGADLGHVLSVEDDDETASFIERRLTEAGDMVERRANAVDAISMAADGSYDVIIFDRMLPGMDGLEAVQLLREQSVLTPVLILTARTRGDGRVEGLDAGADDYVVKPFASSELYARLKALVRRPSPTGVATELVIVDLCLNRLTSTVTRGGETLDLSQQKSRILE